MRWTRSAGHDGKIERLQRVSLLRACRAPELQRLAAGGELVHVPDGTVLQQDGDDVAWVHLVLEGELAVTPPGGEAATGQLRAGDLVGDMEALAGRPASATVVATTDVTALVIGRRQFLAAMDTCPTFRSAEVVSLAGRLIDASTAASGAPGRVYRLPARRPSRSPRAVRARRTRPAPGIHPAGVARRLVPSS